MCVCVCSGDLKELYFTKGVAFIRVQKREGCGLFFFFSHYSVRIYFGGKKENMRVMKHDFYN